MFGTGSEWFWSMCQALVVAGTAVLVFRQIRLQGSSHTVTAFAALEKRWNSRPMLLARRQLCSVYTNKANVLAGSVSHLCMFFEELGAYCKANSLDSDVAWEIYSFVVEHYWVMTKNQIISYRNDEGDATTYHNFEYLYNHFRTLSVKKKAPIQERTDGDLEKFADYEVNRVDFFLQSAETDPAPRAADSDAVPQKATQRQQPPPRRKG